LEFPRKILFGKDGRKAGKRVPGMPPIFSYALRNNK
jgi:hypothetical protein